MKAIKYIMTLAVIFTSCKEPMKEIKDPNYAHPFSPINFSVSPGSFDVATVSWDVIDGALTFIVELSRGDNLEFDNIVATYETETNRRELTLTGLWGETRYSVRVKSKAMKEGQEDSRWASLTFVTNAENIFYDIGSITETEINLYWTPNSEVTHLVIVPATGEEMTIPLTEEEIALGTKTLTELKPGTQHTIMIYNGEQSRGRIDAKTAYLMSDNLLINGSFEQTGCSAANNILCPGWSGVEASWFNAYYPDDPGTAAIGTLCTAQFATQGTDYFGDGGATVGRLPYFRDEGMLDGNRAVRIQNQRTAGVYQVVSVTPGRMYWYKGNFGFTRPNANHTIKDYETLKLLSPDGMTKYHEALIIPPGANLNLGDYVEPAAATNDQYFVSQVTGYYTIPAGVTQVRFQVDFREFPAPNRAPTTLLDDFHLREVLD